MLEQIMANGNEIAFDQTEFRINRLPWKKGRTLTERVRTYIPRLKPLVMPFLVRRESDEGLTQTEAIEFFLDLFGVLETSIVEEFQDTMFAYVSFRQTPQAEFKGMVVPSGIAGSDSISLEELAFQNMGQIDIYLLMLRCIYVNFQKDIEAGIRLYQRQAQAEAVTATNEPETVAVGE